MPPCKSKNDTVKSFRELLDRYDDLIDRGFDYLHKKAQKIDKKGYLIATQMQHTLSDMLNRFNAHRADIYKSAGKVKEYLDAFSEEDSKNILKALNGDIDKSALKGDSLLAYERIRSLLDKNADELVKAGALDEKSRIKDYVKRYYEKYLDEKGKVKKFFMDRKFKRKDLSYEERVELGMIEDASYVVPRTLLEQRTQLLKAEFFKELDEKFGEDSPLDDDYVLVPKIELSSGIYKYGALSGRYVPGQIKKMLDDAHLLKEQYGFAEKYLYPLIDHIKVNVTVKNPVTHVYNILSNLQVSALQGTLTNVGRVIEMYKKDRAGFEALLREVEPFGLDSMLKDMEHIKPLSDKKGVNAVASLFNTLYLSESSKAGKKIREVYDWEDKIFKLAAYDYLKSEKIRKLGRELNESEKLEVYKEAVAPYANYSTPLPATVKLLDKTGISPFMHYVYKSTPAVAKLIAKHPIKYALIQALLLESGASIWSNEDEALKPTWAGEDSKINLFMAKDWAAVPFLGGGVYWNAGRMMPGMKIGAIDASGGFVGGAIRIANGETPLGYSIGSKYDSMPEKIWKRIMALAENYAPPLTFGRYGQRVVKKLSGEELKNYYKEDMTFAEIGKRALGIRHFNESKEAAKKIREAERRYKYFVKKNPDKKEEYLEEYRKRVAEIKAQGKRKGVAISQPKRRKKKPPKFIKDPITKGLIDFGKI